MGYNAVIEGIAATFGLFIMAELRWVMQRLELRMERLESRLESRLERLEETIKEGIDRIVEELKRR